MNFKLPFLSFPIHSMNAWKLVYIVFIHFIVACLVWNSSFVQRFKHDMLNTDTPRFSSWYRTMVGYHLRMDKNVPDNAVVFIGDSITQGLATSAIAVPSINYGIGGDTSYGVMNRISRYTSIQRASAVVIAIGFNDVDKSFDRDILENYKKIIGFIPENVPVVIGAILPVDEKVERLVGINKRIAEINERLRSLVKMRSNIQFVDPTADLIDPNSNLKSYFHEGDGIHLSPSGYDILIKKLKKAIESN